MPSISGECGLRQAVSDVYLTVFGCCTAIAKFVGEGGTSMPPDPNDDSKTTKHY